MSNPVKVRTGMYRLGAIQGTFIGIGITRIYLHASFSWFWLVFGIALHTWFWFRYVEKIKTTEKHR